jgi:hypothetical protein
MVAPRAALHRGMRLAGIALCLTVAAAALIAPHLRRDAARTVALFDLSERNLRRHDHASLDRMFHAVH